MKIDDILEDLPTEDSAMLMHLLTASDEQGGFLVGSRKVAQLVTDYTPHSVGVSAVLRWRRAYADENVAQTV